jgi:hypothetical protein
MLATAVHACAALAVAAARLAAPRTDTLAAMMASAPVDAARRREHKPMDVSALAHFGVRLAGAAAVFALAVAFLWLVVWKLILIKINFFREIFNLEKLPVREAPLAHAAQTLTRAAQTPKARADGGVVPPRHARAPSASAATLRARGAAGPPS